MNMKPANKNPWYILMTLYGEQGQEGDGIDRELHEKNRTVWNAWSCQNLTDEERAKLESDGVELPKVGAWDAMAVEMAKRHKQAFEKRNGSLAGYKSIPDVAEVIDLSRITFSNTVVLGNAVFSSVANFNSATFSYHALFVSATFSSRADFGSATFSADSNNFSSATFSGAVNFSSATFNIDVDFISATFSSRASFNQTTFSGSANFSFATFRSSAHFASATFSSAADFVSATFSSDVDFRSATFSSHVDFRSATFDAPAGFVGTKFGNPDAPHPAQLNLTDAQFEKPASFRGAVFLNYYPDFTGAIVHEKTLFPWEKENWPTACDQDAKEGRDSCAALRHHLAKQGLPEAEMFFFQREMGFARQIGKWPERLPYLIYGWLSDYGHSIIRPANCLLALFILGAFAVHFATCFGLMKSFGYSFANMFKFFGLQRTYFDLDVIQMWAAWLQWVSGGQTVLSFILLFFLGLGLRTRFRLR